jgi:hypothetical protein
MSFSAIRAISLQVSCIIFKNDFSYDYWISAAVEHYFLRCNDFVTKDLIEKNRLNQAV